jgi:hypothetical protein
MWIDAKKRKPKSGRIVLVYTPDRTILELNVLLGTYWDDTKDWAIYDFEKTRDLIVTHWMPLPKRPNKTNTKK